MMRATQFTTLRMSFYLVLVSSLKIQFEPNNANSFRSYWDIRRRSRISTLVKVIFCHACVTSNQDAENPVWRVLHRLWQFGMEMESHNANWWNLEKKKIAGSTRDDLKILLRHIGVWIGLDLIVLDILSSKLAVIPISLKNQHSITSCSLIHKSWKPHPPPLHVPS